MSEKRKIGEGHAGGMGRKGFTELGQYLPAFNTAGTQTVEDQAVWPNKTAGEIARDRDPAAADRDETAPSPEVAAELARMQGRDQRSQSRGR